MTDSGRSERRRNRRGTATWWAFIICGVLFVGLQTTRLVIDIAQNQSSLTGTLLILVVIGVPLLTAMTIAIWIRPQAVRLRKLKEQFPNSVVFGVQMSLLTGFGFANLYGVDSLRGYYLGTYCVIVADQTGIGFWKGRRRPVQRFLLPWTQVTDVTASTTVLARPEPAISIKAETAKHAAGFRVVPNREGWRLGFAERTPDVAERRVQEVISRRPHPESSSGSA